MVYLLENGRGIEVDFSECSIVALHFKIALVNNQLMCCKHGFTSSVVISMRSSFRRVRVVCRCVLLSP